MIEEDGLRLHVAGELCEFTVPRPTDVETAMSNLTNLEANRMFVVDFAAQRETARHIASELLFESLEGRALDVDRLRKISYAAAPADLIYDYFSRFIQLQNQGNDGLFLTLHERYIQFVEWVDDGPAAGDAASDGASDDASDGARAPGPKQLRRRFVYVPATMITQLTFARLHGVLAQLPAPPSRKALPTPRPDDDVLAYLEKVARCFIAPL
jgi:hypothetical protein